MNDALNIGAGWDWCSLRQKSVSVTLSRVAALVMLIVHGDIGWIPTWAFTSAEANRYAGGETGRTHRHYRRIVAGPQLVTPPALVQSSVEPSV